MFFLVNFLVNFGGGLGRAGAMLGEDIDEAGFMALSSTVTFGISLALLLCVLLRNFRGLLFPNAEAREEALLEGNSTTDLTGRRELKGNPLDPEDK